jgi:hypothetical protein
MRTTKFVRALALAAMLGGAIAAHATTVEFDALNDKGEFVWAGTYDGADLYAKVVYELTAWGGNSATFIVTAANGSSGAGSGANPNRLVSFGVQIVNPDLIGADVPGASEWDATLDRTFPGFGTVDLCNYAGSTCSGGASLGVYMGATDTFTLDLTFASPVDKDHPIRFTSPFPSKWQSVGVQGRSYEFDDDVACTGDCLARTVPEPASLALVVLGLAGVGAARRRRSR